MVKVNEGWLGLGLVLGNLIEWVIGPNCAIIFEIS